VEPREPGRKTTASEKFAELLLDKPGQAFPISNRRRLRTERLEVLEDARWSTRCPAWRGSYVDDGGGTGRARSGDVPGDESSNLA
jgi:hypothetical protein